MGTTDDCPAFPKKYEPLDDGWQTELTEGPGLVFRRKLISRDDEDGTYDQEASKTAAMSDANRNGSPDGSNVFSLYALQAGTVVGSAFNPLQTEHITVNFDHEGNLLPSDRERFFEWLPEQVESGGNDNDKELLEAGVRQYHGGESELIETVTLPTPAVTGSSTEVRRSARLAKSEENTGEGNGAK